MLSTSRVFVKELKIKILKTIKLLRVNAVLREMKITRCCSCTKTPDVVDV